MRTLALLLILANVCLFFWAHYIDVPEAAPLAVATSPAAQPQRLLLAAENKDEAQARAAQTTAELSCISVGPLGSANEVERLAQRLQAAGFTSTTRTEQGEVFAGYWVSLQGFATHAEAEQALTRLHAGGVTDAYILPDANSAEGPPNVLSLGLFSDQARAEQRRDAIAKLGYQPQLQNRMKTGEVHWLDVALQEPGQLLDPTLLQPDSGGIVRLETTACPGNAQDGAASHSASTALAAAQSATASSVAASSSSAATK